MSFLSKGRSVAVAKETTYGATATFLDANYIDYTKADMSTSIEKISRNVIRNSMLKLETLLGQETSSGSIEVELSGAVVGVINGDMLFENGLGVKVPQATATTTTAGSTTSLVNVTSAAGLVVGQTLKVGVGGVPEYVQIKSIATLAITVEPVLSGAPAAAQVVQGLATYTLNKPNGAVASLAVRENLKPQSGSAIDYEYTGCMVSDVTLTYPVGAIATAAFSLAGSSFTINASGTTPVLSCAVLTPIVGKNAYVKVGSTVLVTQDLSIKIANTIADIKALTTSGITNKLETESAITGSFKVEYTGANNMVTLKAGTKASLQMLLKDGGLSSAVTHGIVAPQIKFTDVKRSDDGGILYDSVDFEILSPDCGTVERAISVFFA